MKKALSVLFVLAASLSLVGCGDPTREDVCGGCTDANFKAGCEAGYDACADIGECSLGDYKDAVDSSGICG